MLDKIDYDPKSLMSEAYQIDGISASQCRSIFLDWALCLPTGVDNGPAIQAILAQYDVANPDHPMSAVLRQGLDQVENPKRRGGWRGRERP